MPRVREQVYYSKECRNRVSQREWRRRAQQALADLRQNGTVKEARQ
jgi:hypothetical protein